MTDTQWLWVENPDFMQQRPRKLVADCHDRSPFITIHCGCVSVTSFHVVEMPQAWQAEDA